MPKIAVQVVTIHDKTKSLLAFDLKDLLRALDNYLDCWRWCITDLECFGGESEPMCQAVEASRGAGIWLSSPELLKLAAGTVQTIDGKFIAYPKEIDQRDVDPDTAWAEFPASRAELFIHAVDSNFFEVFTKDPAIATRLQQSFKDVRLEDPELYFGESRPAS
jgi:hypothetical protein